ncbi:hypothetical protein [Mycolicibacterium smegmatis]|uniref:hypothetical protein n=1 Tax=Mycolicibacterium smegmatis TaxID=1772 RepID=UPI001EFB0E4D|nr:hypothetical protein [Mycolicibacterium smegmatis]ULN37079.1 hypothetical protein KZ781_08725 [Mycolicibacterium smegmatis]
MLGLGRTLGPARCRTLGADERACSAADVRRGVRQTRTVAVQKCTVAGVVAVAVAVAVAVQ